MKAIVLSTFVPGLGQLTQGRWLSGIGFFVLGGLLFSAGCGLFGNLLAAIHAAWQPSPKRTSTPAVAAPLARSTVAASPSVPTVQPASHAEEAPGPSGDAYASAPAAPAAPAAPVTVVASPAAITLNLTQHAATPEQVAAGVVDLEGIEATALRRLLTFKHMPDREEVLAAAEAIAAIAKAHGAKTAMIGGAPFLMGPLEIELKLAGIAPLYAFSRRESVDETLPDGSVRKTAVFRHEGFVPA